MKNYRAFLLLCLLGFSSFATQAQGLLGIGATGISGFPATSQFGDTIQNLSVWLVNKGVTPIGSLSVALISQTNSTGLPFQLGTLDLTAGIIQPGDSTQVPLDYFVVTPQNSNQGSNIMVIWPTAPGTTPSDSAETDYEVDGPTEISAALDSFSDQMQIWPNPTNGILHLHVDQIKLKNSKVSVYDAFGKQIFESPLQYDQIIDLNRYPSGVYTLKVVAADGKVIPRRIIKQ